MGSFEYDLADVVTMFVGSFVIVFLLGLQSRNVNMGRYMAAVITSAGISISQFIFVRYAASGNLWALLIAVLGGCSGIASSIWFWKNIMERKYNGNKKHT